MVSMCDGGVLGWRTRAVEVQVQISSGLPNYCLGLPDKAVAEAGRSMPLSQRSASLPRADTGSSGRCQGRCITTCR